MDAEIYTRLRAEIDREYRVKIRTLDRLWAALHSEGEAEAAPQSTRPANERKRGSLLAAVREYVSDAGMSRSFDIHDVKEAVQRRHPSLSPVDLTSASSCLRKLNAERVIDRVRAGAGPHAALYRRVRG